MGPSMIFRHMFASMSMVISLLLAVSGQVGYVYRNPATRMCSLNANLALMKKPVKFRVAELWLYNPEEKKWLKQAFEPVGPKRIGVVKRTVYSHATDPVAAPLTDRIGLFWVKWSEDGRPFAAFVFSGPILCEDIAIGPMTKGDMVATCVPGTKSATAAYVPDPKIYCK